MPRMRILSLESSTPVQEDLESLLKGLGVLSFLGTDLARARALLAEGESFDLAFLDAHPPGGLAEALGRIREVAPELPVLVHGELPTVSLVVEAVRAGAKTFLERPLRAESLGREIEALAGEELELPSAPPLPTLPRGSELPGLVGVSASMRNARELIRVCARSLRPVFVYGPTGTGKEIVARAVHQLSPRAQGPFVPVHCGALPENLVEAELFGSKKGSYTGSNRDEPGLFREAEGGTLFLDELGEMPMAAQVKLLRALQEKRIRPVGSTKEVSIDVRVVTATHRDPRAAIEAGTLRADLFYRLSVLRIELEPLASRPEDVGPLAEHFMDRISRELGAKTPEISPRALAALRGYPWPGNARELENVIDSVLAYRPELECLELEHLPAEISRFGPEPDEAPATFSVDTSGEIPTLRSVEATLIQEAMRKLNGNKSKVATALGISRPYLYRRLHELEVG